MGISQRKLEVVSDSASESEENGAPRTSVVRDRAPEPSATTQIGAWQVVADLLANVQRGVGAVAEKSNRQRFESELRPLARAVTQWQTVAPHPAQSKIVLERLLEIQDELSEIQAG